MAVLKITPPQNTAPTQPEPVSPAASQENPLVSFIENITTESNTTTVVEHKPDWNLVTPYIERSCDKTIKRLISTLESSGKVGFYLSGFSGNGKTTTVKKIVNDLKGNYQDIFYIQIQNSIPASLEEFIQYIIRKIEQDTEYEFNKRRPILAFQEYIKKTKACIILDDFEGEACSLFLDFITEKRFKSIFIFASSSKLISYLKPSTSAEIRARIPEVELGEFTIAEAQEFIDAKLSVNTHFTRNSIEHAKLTIIRRKILNPYALLMTLTYIINHISDERIEDIDELDEMAVFFEDYETDSMIDQSIHAIWSGLSENAKILLLFISFYETSIDINTLTENAHRSKGQYEHFLPYLKSVHELLSNNIVSLSDGKLFSTNSLVKCALDYWMKQPGESDYRDSYIKARLMWVEICCNLVHFVGNCYGDITQLKILDSAGGFEFIKNVVRWCISPDNIDDVEKINKLLEKAIMIGNDSSYYFYVRGDSANLKNSIEMFRFKAASELHNQKEMFDALLTQLNVSCKRNHTEDAKFLYSAIKELEYSPDENSDFNEHVKMKHAFALYHYSLGEYNEALLIWQRLYEKKDVLIAKDVCTVSRWMSDCMIRIAEPSFSYDEIMRVLQYSLDFSSRNNYKRDILQSYFKIVSLKLDYHHHVNEDEFFSKLSAAKEVGDESYTAFYYFLAYRILKLQSTDDKSRLEKARVAITEAEKHYRKIFDDAMCVRIARIISNPDLDDVNDAEHQKDLGLLLTQLY